MLEPHELLSLPTCCPQWSSFILFTGIGSAGTGEEDPEDGVGWGEPAQSQWLLECAGGGPSAALAAAAAAAGGVCQEGCKPWSPAAAARCAQIL